MTNLASNLTDAVARDPVPVEAMRSFEEAFEREILQRYGVSETAGKILKRKIALPTDVQAGAPS
jgi:hypothetical protein